MPVSSTQPVYSPPAGKAVEAPWGVAVAESIPQRFATTGARDSGWTSPPTMALSTTESDKKMWYHDGVSWQGIATNAELTALGATKLNLAGGTLSGAVTGVAPTAAGHLTRKDYVDTQRDTRVARTGTQSMEGPLWSENGFRAPSAPPSGTYLANKTYVDARVGTRLPLTGGSMTGFLALHAAPTAGTHAATKAYVDGRDTLYVRLAGEVNVGNLYIGINGAGNGTTSLGHLISTTGIHRSHVNVGGSPNEAYVRSGPGMGNGNDYIMFRRDHSLSIIGTIDIGSSTSVRYNTTSHAPWKHVEADLAGSEAMALVRQMHPVRFRWKLNADGVAVSTGTPDGDAELGLLAQELFTVFPQAVSQGRGTEGSEDFKPWGYDGGKMAPVFVAALQDLDARLTAAGL